MLKVVIVGYGEMFTNLVAATLDAGCEIVGVFRKDSIKYNSLMKKIKDVFNPSIEYSYIKSYNLYEIAARSVNSDDFRKEILKLNPDIILVGSWSEKFQKETYSIPKIATINAHPSLLPKYRGPNPYFWTIRNQETETGITFHLIDDNLDTGAILAQEVIKIFPSDTGSSLKQKTVLTARGVACELLKTLKEDIVIPLQQIEEKSSYYSYPEDLELDFSKSAADNAALIRACYPWSQAYFYHKDVAIAVSHEKLSIEENSSEYKEFGTIIEACPTSKTIKVLCGDNNVLKMEISLYSKIDKPFTKFFIKREMVCGSQIE